MKTFKVTVVLNDVMATDENDVDFKETVKEALVAAIDADDCGEVELEFTAQEADEDDW